MAKIYRANPKQKLYSLLLPEGTENAEFQHSFDITQQTLKYTLKSTSIDSAEPDPEINSTVISLTLSIDEFKSYVRYHEQGLFSFDVNVAMGGSIEQPLELNKFSVVSLFDLTKSDRNIRAERNDSPSFNFPFMIFVPFESGNFTDFEYLVKSPDANVNSTGAFDQSVYTDTIIVNTGNQIINETKSRQDLLATLTLDSNNATPAAGDTIEIHVTCSEPSVTRLYLDQVSGIANKTEVKLINGNGSFKILTDTLTAGDEVKVKIGFKSFRSVASYTTTLV